MSKLKHILPGEPIPRGSLFHERRYRVAMAEADGLFKGESLLDIGCGNGSQTEFFARHIARCVGIDLQVSRLAGFKRELRERGISNTFMIGASADHLPFKDKSFAFVTCFEVLEHVPDESKTLQEIWRILRPGGSLIVSVPHRWWVFETHGAELPLLPWNRVPFFSWLPRRIHDRWARARNYSLGQIVTILKRSGFNEIKTRLLTAPMDVLRNKKLQRILRASLFAGDTTRIPPLASNIFVCAKKIA